MQRYVVIFYQGKQWLEGKPYWEQNWYGHREYWLRVSESEGAYRLHGGGPFTNHAGGMVIIDVEREEDLQALIRRDPAVVNELLRPEIHPWQPVASSF